MPAAVDDERSLDKIIDAARQAGSVGQDSLLRQPHEPRALAHHEGDIHFGVGAGGGGLRFSAAAVPTIKRLAPVPTATSMAKRSGRRDF